MQVLRNESCERRQEKMTGGENNKRAQKAPERSGNELKKNYKKNNKEKKPESTA